MAYNSSDPRAEYVSSSGQTVYPFTFKIYKTSDVKAYLTPVGNTANDATDILVLGVNYTITVDGDNGGTFTLLSPATTGDKVTITRDLPIIRDVDYQTSGDLLAETLNQDQNYQTYMLADNAAKNDRYVKVPESAQNVDTDLPNPSADNYIKWNTAGTALENDTTAPVWATAAANSAAAALVSEGLAEADKVQTGLDRTATSSDASSTAQDSIDTNDDKIQTTADAVSTALDAIATSNDRAAIEVIYDNFDDRYLGAFAVAPTLDNDGNPLQVGAMYFDTVVNNTRFYSGGSWEDPEATATAAALSTTADLALTNADVVSTNADVVLTSADVVSSGNNATATELDKWITEAERMTTDSYATEPENVFVKSYVSDGDGTFTATDTTEYSALHWSAKAEASAQGTAANIAIVDTASKFTATNVEAALLETQTLRQSHLSSVASSVLLNGTLDISGTDLTITDAEIMYSNGYDENGAKNSVEIITGTNTITPSNGYTVSADNYIKKIEGGTYVSTAVEPVYGKGNSRASAVNPDVYVDGKWYDSINGSEKVTNGTFDTVADGVFGYDNADGTVDGITNDQVNIVSSIVNNTLNIANNTGVGAGMSYTITGLTIGTKYTLAQDKALSATLDYAITRISFDSSTYTTLSLITDTTVGISSDFVADATSVLVYNYSYAGGVNHSIKYDNISLFETIVTPATAYTTPITYLPLELEVDASGNPVLITDTKKVEVVAEKIVAKEVACDNFKGKNACTAWVNFDGTTTPPTIRDSFNVSDVVRISNAVQRVYFLVPMDNINYSITTSGRNATIGANTVASTNTDYVELDMYSTQSTFIEPNVVGVQVFGGKN